MASAAFIDMRIQAVIWQGLAEEAAAVAAQLQDADLRLSMLSIAAEYEAMVRRAEAMSLERDTPSARGAPPGHVLDRAA